MKILFVCTWNVFRSMSAEYLTKKYLEDNKFSDIQVSSAGIGTIERPQEPFQQTINRLNYYWCNFVHHDQVQVTTDLLKDQDLIICMSQVHIDFVKDLWYQWILFNEIAYWKNEDLMDDGEFREKNVNVDLDTFCPQTIDYIHDAIPFIIKNIRKQSI